MRCSRAGLGLGLGIEGGDEEAKAEVAGKTQCNGATHRLRKAQFEHTAERVRLREAAFAAAALDCSFPLHAGTPQVKFRNLPTVRR